MGDALPAQTMSAWSGFLFAGLVVVSLVALFVGMPGQLRALAQFFDASRMGGSLPPVAMGLTIAQNVVLAVAAAAVGVALGRQTGLRAPFFESLATGASPWRALQEQMGPGVIAGVGAGVAFVALYYGVVRPWIGAETALIGERIRVDMGLASRVLLGGVFEEVLYRWGVMGFAAWIGMKITGTASPAVMWAAILASGLVFGLGHLPGPVGLGIRLTPALVGTTIVINLMAGVVFGWLFWRYGLVSAMIAHGLMHVVWFPFERHAVRGS